VAGFGAGARGLDLAATAQLARGEDPSPYVQLGAAGAVAYRVALFGMQRRR